MPHSILHSPDGHRGTFAIHVEAVSAATLTYTMAGTTMIIDHTDVGPSLRGTGAGNALVAAAVDFARANGLHIIPLCPFAKSVFDKTADYADIRR